MNARRMSEYRLIESLREMEQALGNAYFDGVIAGHAAIGLQKGCNRHARRLARKESRRILPIARIIPSALRTLRRAAVVEQAHQHLERCLEYLDAAVDSNASGLLDDTPFEARVASAIEMLNTATPRDDESER